MKLKRLQERLNGLWSGSIENHYIDLFNHYILFEIKVINGYEITNHSVKFKNVKSYYYLNDQIPYEPEKDDYLELTSVTYVQERKIVVRCEASQDFYRSSAANFIIEIWSRELYIDASIIEIDGETFDLL